MKITFGKHNGKDVEKIMISFPGYIDWLQRNSTSEVLKAYIRQCKASFDSRPFTIRCFGTNQGVECKKKATRISVLSDNLQPYFWCDSCDPYMFSVNKALGIISTYQEALNYVHTHCNNSNPDFKYLITQLAEAKGLTGRKTIEKILEFFNGN